MPPLQEARIPASDDPTAPLPILPQYFVDRKDILRAIQVFLEKARLGQSARRSFVIKGNSGWGKSSLVLKLVEWTHGRSVRRISVTAVDSRVAKDRSFVTEAIRIALSDAVRLINEQDVNLLVEDAKPLSTPDVVKALTSFKERAALVVLVFDQFEDFVTRPELSEAFAVVTDLIRDLERTKPPFAVGFTWKTDLTAPYSDSAVQRWNDLRDLMEPFVIEELTMGDIWLIVEIASKAIAAKNGIPHDLKSQIVDQSVNYPWLAKKLLTHVFNRIGKGYSPKTLLLGNLAVESLFEADLRELDSSSFQCLKFVAAQGAINLLQTKDQCSEQVLAELVKRHLLVRAGTQYRVSWEILREYLVSGEVPPIPWAPPLHNPDSELMIKAFAKLRAGPLKTNRLQSRLKVQKPYFDRFLGDLMTLGLVEFVDVDEDRIGVSKGLESKSVEAIAQVVGDNLRRHDVYRAFARQIPPSGSMPSEDWNEFFLRENWRTKKKQNPGDTWEPSARALRRWLQFAGLIEEEGDRITHPLASHATATQKTKIRSSRRQPEKLFVGNSKPSHLEELVSRLRRRPKGMAWTNLAQLTTGNAIRDAIALGLAVGQPGGAVHLTEDGWQGDPLSAVRRAVEGTPSMQDVKRLAGDDDPEEKFTNEGLGGAVGLEFGKRWTANSAERVGTGLISFYRWLEGFRPGPAKQLEAPAAKPVPKEIPPGDVEKLVKILAGLGDFYEARGRRALISQVGGPEELVQTIDFQGSSITVARDLIQKLLGFWRPQLRPLLELIQGRGDVSDVNKQTVNKILNYL